MVITNIKKKKDLFYKIYLYIYKIINWKKVID